ncbi:hypothetical protein ACS0TY_036047 [Phlomoides rotata]
MIVGDDNRADAAKSSKSNVMFLLASRRPWKKIKVFSTCVVFYSYGGVGILWFENDGSLESGEKVKSRLSGPWFFSEFGVFHVNFVLLIVFCFLHLFLVLFRFPLVANWGFNFPTVTSSIYNPILGKLYCDHYGTMRIQGNHEYSCKLKFKEQSIIDRNPHQVQGAVQDKSGKTVATQIGKWDESMHYVNGDYSKGKSHESLSEAHLLWKRSRPPQFPTRYNLTRFAITLNELIPGLKEKLPPTDSRLRPDQRCLENGEYEMANAEKLRLEQRQRQVTFSDLGSVIHD